ncbi:iron donor protein CyaY [Kerstersia sp.]|uniref:iron donor protein CyaY n=1 Tax=Kerstersia sp. TaxID=1930783 RepID=UPI003F91A168
MTETEFLARAHAVLETIERQVDDWNATADVDIEASFSGNVLTLAFENGEQVVINSQAAMREIWVAARSGGFHYRLVDDKTWQDTRGGPDLQDAVSQICSNASGETLVLKL